MFASSRRLLLSGWNLFVKEGTTTFGGSSQLASKWQALPASKKAQFQTRAVLMTPRVISPKGLFSRAHPGQKWVSQSAEEKAKYTALASKLSARGSRKPPRAPTARSLFMAKTVKGNIRLADAQAQWKALPASAKAPYEAEARQKALEARTMTNSAYSRFLSEKMSKGTKIQDAAAEWRSLSPAGKAKYTPAPNPKRVAYLQKVEKQTAAMKALRAAERAKKQARLARQRNAQKARTVRARAARAAHRARAARAARAARRARLQEKSVARRAAKRAASARKAAAKKAKVAKRRAAKAAAAQAKKAKVAKRRAAKAAAAQARKAVAAKRNAAKKLAAKKTAAMKKAATAKKAATKKAAAIKKAASVKKAAAKKAVAKKVKPAAVARRNSKVAAANRPKKGAAAKKLAARSPHQKAVAKPPKKTAIAPTKQKPGPLKRVSQAISKIVGGAKTRNAKAKPVVTQVTKPARVAKGASRARTMN